MTDIVESTFEITDEEIATLNASRTLLEKISKRARVAGYEAVRLDAVSFGRLAERSEVAEDTIFQCLNLISAHRLADLTKDQIHNTAQEPLTATESDENAPDGESTHPYLTQALEGS